MCACIHVYRQTADAGAYNAYAMCASPGSNININILKQYQQLVEHILRPLLMARPNLNSIWCTRKSNMPRTLPLPLPFSLSLYFSRHIGIASDRIRKRHVWHILSAKAKPKFDLPKNKLKQQKHEKTKVLADLLSFLPSFRSSFLPCWLPPWLLLHFVLPLFAHMSYA